MFLRIKKIVGVSASIILLVSWFTYGFLENTYVNYPRFANPQSGSIVPHEVKGVIVYLKKGQEQLLSYLEWIGIASGVVIALVILIHRGDPFRATKAKREFKGHNT
jgi:hypothetical protein